MPLRALLGGPAAREAGEGGLHGVVARAIGPLAAPRALPVRGTRLGLVVALGAQGREGREGPNNLIHVLMPLYGTLNIMNLMTIPILNAPRSRLAADHQIWPNTRPPRPERPPLFLLKELAQFLHPTHIDLLQVFDPAALVRLLPLFVFLLLPSLFRPFIFSFKRSLPRIMR